MDIFFSRRYTYTVNRPANKVCEDFSKVANKKWSDAAENIRGTLNSDNSFKFTGKWSMGSMMGIFGSDLATVKGSIKENGQKTVVEITLHPNAGLVFFVYLMLVLFLFEVLDIPTIFSGPKTFFLLFFPFFGLVIYGLIFSIANGLRNRFEKVFRLQRDQTPYV